ncbi:Universal stress protein family [Pseudomonas syringae pv. tomato]|nr:Universal stress protein E [Pseudomonas syringae pv. tomato]KUR49802.1 Universal stress protein E [Pseudomonas syringae pv. tomato]RMQ77393.1 Universal stress protein family [Pseudomonas syringae pv. tomato]RMW30309.1 Universal stress protein family [Pseudomonas syringae pv. antirrhini]CAI8930800.1 Universal stress protein [Pseudomonas syringae pv. tomato]
MFESERLMLIASPLMSRTPAFERAAALARAKSAALHIVAFDYVEGLAAAGLLNERALNEMRDGYLASHRQWLEQQAQLIRQSGVEVTTEVVWVMRPLDEIMAHVHEIKPSMVIKDIGHESWLTRAMFTSLDIRLLHDCPVPLHLVANVDHALPRKILAAVDPYRTEEQFGDVNEVIIKSAEKLAAQCNAQLHLLYAHDMAYIFASAGDLGLSTSLEHTLYETDQEAFDQLADRFGVPDECRHVVTGSPAKVISAFVLAEGIDVIVMGTLHRNRVDTLLGSTTEQVAHHLSGSLLALNPRLSAL